MPRLFKLLIEQLKTLSRILTTWVGPNIEQFVRTHQARIWLLSIAVGAAVAVAAILFREGIGLVQWIWLGTRSERVFDAAQNLNPFWLLFGPTIGGLIVGLLLYKLTARRCGGVADVIEARALTSRKLPLKDGLWSALITIISLGFGASSGREGPLVHLGATLSTYAADKNWLDQAARRTILAGGVASAVAASFNAPIAGVLFAHEVILGHYAMRSFVPIVISATAGSILSRLWFGEDAAFYVPTYQVTSYWEFPAFALLGVTAAVVAVIFQFSLFAADYVARRFEITLWVRPVIGGLMIGMIALVYPQVLGVGYQTTDMAVWNQLPLTTIIALIIAKTAATSITLASRFGGGIFSPAIVLGALTGAAFGIIASSVFPGTSSSEGLYAILGMGAVAGAVLGAPISTTMIVFELTGGYALSIALLLSCAIAHGITQAIHGHSYFHWQLEMRGIYVHDGPHRLLTRHRRVMDFMDRLPADSDPVEIDPEAGEATLLPTDSLEKALRLFDSQGHQRLAVVDRAGDTRIIAYASHVKALRYFNKALIEFSEEEHK